MSFELDKNVFWVLFFCISVEKWIEFLIGFFLIVYYNVFLRYRLDSCEWIRSMNDGIILYIRSLCLNRNNPSIGLQWNYSQNRSRNDKKCSYFVQFCKAHFLIYQYHNFVYYLIFGKNIKPTMTKGSYYSGETNFKDGCFSTSTNQ